MKLMFMLEFVVAFIFSFLMVRSCLRWCATTALPVSLSPLEFVPFSLVSSDALLQLELQFLLSTPILKFSLIELWGKRVAGLALVLLGTSTITASAKVWGASLHGCGL